MRATRRHLVFGVVLAVLAALATPSVASSVSARLAGDNGATAEPPHPDPAFLPGVPGDECIPLTPEDKSVYGSKPRYPGVCKRMHFTFGPIEVKPGQNEAMLKPVVIDKPGYDGYLIRFQPDLVRAIDGSKPFTETLHLHHATWLNLGEAYGSGPFFAAGEEKTISNLPKGYGMEVKGSDQWGLLYMVHNATANTEVVWLTYAVDYIAKADGDKLGLTPVKPIWLDVQGEQIHPDAPSTSSNPVFNVQKGFGRVDPETKRRVCTWPKENCARFDVYDNVTPQQGKPIKIAGADWEVPEHLAGTLVGLGGHLHPGGIRDEVSLVRNGVEKPIFISDAIYWDPAKHGQAGAQPKSWNMSMTITGSPLDWKVKIRKGDKLRINAVYDSELGSWYEGMGIVVAYVAPKDPIKPAGVDVFTDNVILDRGVPSKAPKIKGYWDGDKKFRPGTCTADLTGATKRLCLRGMVTHGMYHESTHTGGCPKSGCPALPKKDGPLVTDIHSVGFTYGNADLGVIGQTGIPLVKKGQPVRFWNEDAAARIWHTFTRCKEPCTGTTGIDYPIADGGKGAKDHMDFDSAEIGWGLMFEPAKSQVGGSDPYDDQWVKDAAVWEFTPDQTGVFTFWCRIHPGMRGAFKVVE